MKQFVNDVGCLMVEEILFELEERGIEVSSYETDQHGKELHIVCGDISACVTADLSVPPEKKPATCKLYDSDLGNYKYWPSSKALYWPKSEKRRWWQFKDGSCNRFAVDRFYRAKLMRCEMSFDEMIKRLKTII